MRARFCLRVLPKAYLDPYYPRHVGEQFGVLPFNGWVGWEVQTSQTSPFLSPWLLLAHLRPTWQPKISSTEGSWRKMPSRAATIAPRLTHSRALYSGNKTHKHTHTHSLIMYNMWTLIHREQQSQFQVRHAALRILGILLRGFTCGGIWITASCLCEHHCALLTRFGSTLPDLFCQERSQNSVFCAVDGTFLSGLFWDPVTRGAWKVKLHVHAYWLTFFLSFLQLCAVGWTQSNSATMTCFIRIFFFFLSSQLYSQNWSHAHSKLWKWDNKKLFLPFDRS